MIKQDIFHPFRRFVFFHFWVKKKPLHSGFLLHSFSGYYFIFSTIALNASGLFKAKSAKTLRLRSMLAA